MTPTSDDIRAHAGLLNRSFYQENGPGDFILMRLYALCVVGGCYDQFKDILAEGVDFAKCKVQLMPTEGNDPDGLHARSDEEFRQHFLRIESHHLKHLAIETLLRMFLGHRGFPACPWYEISSFTNFKKFKKAVRTSIVESEIDGLQSGVLDVLLGRSGDRTTSTADDLDISHNLSKFLQAFAADWLSEANSYNATKHGLTAIPGVAHLRTVAENEEIVDLGYAEFLTHLSYEINDDNTRVWSMTTRGISLEHAVASIMIVIEMLDSLWSVARCRYGLSETYRTFRSPESVLSIDNLRDVEIGPAFAASFEIFSEPRLR